MSCIVKEIVPGLELKVYKAEVPGHRSGLVIEYNSKAVLSCLREGDKYSFDISGDFEIYKVIEGAGK